MKAERPLITVQGLHKKFARRLRDALRYELYDLFNEIRGAGGVRELRKGEFWSLSDVNLEIRRGECVGLIGPNGAGKSTLLKILNGLLKPDRGRVEIRGSMGALIELGTGFNPILTGRENIYVNGSILGFSRRQIDRAFDRIVEFSELEDFIEMPVQSYSSGMRVRLGFAIAAQVRPDILLIDEILAVGDVGFRTKCINAIAAMSSNAAIVFVSHSMSRIAKMCDRVVVLEQGKVIEDTDQVASGIGAYQRLFRNVHSDAFGEGSVALREVAIADPEIASGASLRSDIGFGLPAGFRAPVRLHLTVITGDGSPVAQWRSASLDWDEANGGVVTARVRIRDLNLSNGTYFLNLRLTDPDGRVTHLGIDRMASFDIVAGPLYSAPMVLAGEVQCDSQEAVS